MKNTPFPLGKSAINEHIKRMDDDPSYLSQFKKQNSGRKSIFTPE